MIERRAPGVCGAALAAAAALSSVAPAAEGPSGPKHATAVRVANDSIRVDGRLDDGGWSGAPEIADFVQKEPVFGGKPRDAMSVRFVYDDDALYVGARMEARGRRIQASLSRRDDTFRSEHLWISLDTYGDRRTAYSFGVSAAGVRMDFVHRSDSETDVDQTFEPVWRARTRVDEEGWTAELRIPFSQLRFNDRPDLVFGLNVDRWIPSLNEDVFWIPVPKDATGWSSRMGELRGLSGVKPSRRLEITPYVAPTATTSADLGTPLRDGWDQGQRVGADLKMGLGPNLTLESTIRPDFGQVEADPAEVNLSAFETFFDERRPFFTEGADLFDNGTGFFYSRRIGASPKGDAVGDDVRYPASSEILGAAKLTGRLPSGLSVGGLAAVTRDESARVFDAGVSTVSRVGVAPRTGYGIARLRQEIGKNASTVGVLFTGVTRDLQPGTPLAAIYSRRAFGGILDWNYRYAGGNKAFAGNLGFTHVEGDAAAIAALQQASTRFFQRPDATHVRFDPTRTSLSGFTGGIEHARYAGRFPYDLYCGFESPALERNDLGRLRTSDGQFCSWRGGFRQTKPGFFHEYKANVTANVEWNYAREAQDRSFVVDSVLTWRNYWRTTLAGSLVLPAQDERLTRGGPTMGTPTLWTLSIDQSTRTEGNRGANARLFLSRDRNGGYGLRVSGELRARPQPKFELRIAPNYLRNTDARQYVATLDGGRPETFGRRYVFATVDQTTFLVQLRAAVTLRADLNLDFYAEPFASSGRYYGFGELLAPRSRLLQPYGLGGATVVRNVDGTRTLVDGDTRHDLATTDFRTLSFRSNVVLRWEYRPGSTLYAVWQQNRSDDGGRYGRAGVDDLLSSFSSRGENVVALKASFFWGVK